MEVLTPGDPRRIGGYRLLGRLGSGGMGRVYLGRSRGGRMVAVKLVHPELAHDPKFLRRFRREVEAARRVGGEWTAPVLDADTESATPWVATGYVPGPTLSETVERHGPLPESTVLALASGLARALQAIHACDLVHRDLKPSNVLVTIDGPRVIDFGIVRSADSVTTRAGALIGSPPFMSPEQARGAELTSASDVFSLGSVLAYAATGHRPFGSGAGGLHALLFRVLNEPPDLRDLTGPVRDLVESCLAKAPEERPAPAAIVDALPPMPASWLPAEVVAELGRHAAGLLDLEGPEATAPQPVPQASTAPAARPPADPAESQATSRRRGSLIRLYLPIGAAAATTVIAVGLVFTLANGDRTNAAGPGATATESAAKGDVPAGMVGTWDGSVHKAVSSKWSHQRITLIQGRLGQKVARIRSVSGTQICEYTAVMTANSPSVVLRPRVTRSIPKGYCDPPPQQTMTLNGRDLRWASGDLAGTLYRARHDAVPPGLRGRWTGIAPGFTAVPTEGMRMRFDIGGGAVGTSAIRITTSIGDVTCEKEAMLISAENKIFFVPVRLLTPDGCVLGSEQQLTPKGPNLVWQDLSTDEGADLRPS